MDAYRGQAHYSPLSVGAFVDPAFLRGAALDANEERRAERVPFAGSLRLRWADALRVFKVALRRR